MNEKLPWDKGEVGEAPVRSTLCMIVASPVFQLQVTVPPTAIVTAGFLQKRLVPLALTDAVAGAPAGVGVGGTGVGGTAVGGTGVGGGGWLTPVVAVGGAA